METIDQFSQGSRIAGYQIEEQIGQGGMAVVYRAHDDRLDRTVALKILAPALAADEAFRQRFIRESRAAAAVDDPHILPVFEAGEASGVLFIAMRFVPGGDVGSLGRRPGQVLSADRVTQIIGQAASALDAAHARGLVHRDVKPANILLDVGGDADDRPDHVYLSDFGLSKWALQTTGLTGTGMYLGTIDYSAPEQIEGKVVDGRSDQYSLACTAFQMLTGTAPFHRPEVMATLYAQVSEPPPAVTSLRPDLPKAADEVFATALAKDPAGRFPTCRGFTAALRSALGSGVVVAEEHEPRTHQRPVEAAEVVIAPPPYRYDRSPTQTAFPNPARQSAETVPPLAAPAPHRAGRPGSLILVGAAVLIAGSIIAAAVLLRSPATGPAALRGSGATGNATTSATTPSAGTPSASQQQTLTSPVPTSTGQVNSAPSSGQVSSAPASSGVTAPAVNLGQAGYRLARVLSPGVPGSMSSVAWNPAGTLVATSDQNDSTYLWNAATGQQAGSPIAGPASKTFAAAFSPDGTELATGYKDGYTYLWSASTGQLLAKVRDPGSSRGQEVDSVAFSPDGKTLATSDGNGYTNLWSVSDGGRQLSLVTSLFDPADAGVYSAVFSSTGTLATGDYIGNVYIWDISAGTPSATFTLPGTQCPPRICAAVSALAFNSDGSVLAAANESGAAELWSVAGQASAPLDLPVPAAGLPIWALAFSGGGELALADADGEAYLYQVDSSALTASVVGALEDPNSGDAPTGDRGVSTVAFGPDGDVLVTGDTNGNAYLWRLG